MGILKPYVRYRDSTHAGLIMLSCRFGLIIIGDEILSGKRQDQHFANVVSHLQKRGLHLSWVHILGDDRAQIIGMLHNTFASQDIVFCCGGIGATPDDHTRQGVAAALNTHLEPHPAAQTKIIERIRELSKQQGLTFNPEDPANQQRLKMAEFPPNARLIPNPINQIPGFSVFNHHFVPGFPAMASPMIEWVLDEYYAAYFHKTPHSERSLLVYQPEAVLTPIMEALEAEFSQIKVFSLPSLSHPSSKTQYLVELGVKGHPSEVDAAFSQLIEQLKRHGYAFDLRNDV